MKRLMTTTMLMAIGLALPVRAGEWNQFRGPGGTGAIDNYAWPDGAWGEAGPRLLWKSDELPADKNGGFGSPVVADGRVYVYVAWRKKRPIAERHLSGRALDRLGLYAPDVPADRRRKIEDARESEARAALDGRKAKEWARQWVRDNLDEDQRKKYGRYAEDRLKRGPKAHSLELLGRLHGGRDRRFENQAAFDAWLDQQDLTADTRAYLVKLVPTTEEYTEDVIACLDVADGKTRWLKTYPGRSSGWGASGTPCVADGKVYAAGSTGKAYCLDARTGEEVWTAEIGRGVVNSSFASVGELVCIQSGGLKALKAATGEEQWKAACGGGNTSPAPWRLGDKTYVLVNGKKAGCVDPADGRILWQVPGGGDSSVAAAGNCMALNTKGILIYRITPEKAELVKQHKGGNRGSSVATDGERVFAFSGGAVACFDAASGEIRWQVKAGREDFGSPILAGNRILAPVGNELVLIDAGGETGELLARAKVERIRCSTPALTADRLVMRAKDGLVCYALD